MLVNFYILISDNIVCYSRSHPSAGRRESRRREEGGGGGALRDDTKGLFIYIGHNNLNHSHKGVYVAHVVVETLKNVIIKTLIIDIIIRIENDRSFMLMS